MGAPVTHVVSSHRALKKQENNDIWVSIETYKHSLQTNFGYINKMTSFTNIMTNVGNHKSRDFVKNKPKHLWPLLIWIKYNK